MDAQFEFTVQISCLNALDSGSYTSSSCYDFPKSWTGSGNTFNGSSNDTINVSCTAASGNWSTQTFVGVSISGVSSSNKFTINSKSTYASVGVNIANQMSVGPTSTSSSATTAYCNVSISLTKNNITKTVSFYVEINKSGGGTGGGIIGPTIPDDRL